MSWKIQKYRPIDTDAMDIRDINENFYGYIDELSGGLNEHNFTAGAFTGNERLTADAAMAAHQVLAPGDPTSILSTETLAYKTQWEPVSAAANVTTPLRKVIVATGGPVWVMASFQLVLSTSLNTSGFQFVLALDGAPLFESLFGGGDLSNDEIVSTGLFTYGPAVQGQYLPIVLEAYLDLTPGEYTLEVLTRSLMELNGGVGSVGVSVREFIVLDMFR